MGMPELFSARESVSGGERERESASGREREMEQESLMTKSTLRCRGIRCEEATKHWR